MLAIILILGLTACSQASLLCPTHFDPTVTVHLPHPTSCSKYLTCVGSDPVEQDCPARLHWSEQHSYCDYPRTVRCSRVDVGEDGSGGPESFNATVRSNSVCLPQNNRCPINSNPTEQVVFLKHRDCRKFYACVASQPVELSCPHKLYWNSRACVCDYEKDVECDEAESRNIEEEEDVEVEEQQPQEESNGEVEGIEHEEPNPEQDEVEKDSEQGPDSVGGSEAVVLRARRAADGETSDSSGSSGSNDGSSSSGSSSGGSSSGSESGSSSSGSNSGSSGTNTGSSGSDSSSSSGSSSGSGSGSSGSGSSSGSGGSTPIQSGADVRTFSSLLVIVGTFVMSMF